MILALRALGLGDLLTAVPALRGLRAAFPAHRLVLAAPSPLRDLAGLTGAVDDLLPTAGLGPIDWPGGPPTLAVNLHGRGPQSTHALRALAPQRLLTYEPGGTSEQGGPAWDPDVHEVDRWCRLLASAGIPTDPADLAIEPPGVNSPVPGAVVVHPGAAFGARRWPADRYAVVARLLAADGHRVVVTGSAAEQDLAARVVLGSAAVLAGRTTLTELAALVASAVLVVCGDTGAAHLATAYGTPSVVLFGPVPPRLWGPPPGRAQHVALWAGRTGDTFADHPDPGLLELTPDDVLAAASGLLAAGQRRERPSPRTALR